MMYSCVPMDIVFYDETLIRQRHIRLYNNISFEMLDGRVERIISTNPQDYLKYHGLLGTDKI
ncbi:MAG: YlzJ-like family protein [Clostridia bacterium]|nr:YlzJ-like family protein [Clostridia bacterium]